MRIISANSNQPGKSHKQSQFQGSGAAIGGAIASSYYFRKKREQELQAQQAQMQGIFGPRDQYQPAFFPPVQPSFQPNQTRQSSPIHFGSLEWLTGTLSGSAVGKGLDYLLQSLSDCKDDNNKKALAYLEQAHNSSNHSGQAFYLEKAEAKFLNAALALKDSKQKAEAYKNLAIVSKMLQRDAKVTDSYVEKCMAHFDDYRASIEVQRVGAQSSAMGGSPFALLHQLRFQEAADDYNDSDTPKVCSKLHSTKTYAENPIATGRSQRNDSSCIIL